MGPPVRINGLGVADWRAVRGVGGKEVNNNNEGLPVFTTDVGTKGELVVAGADTGVAVYVVVGMAVDGDAGFKDTSGAGAVAGSSVTGNDVGVALGSKGGAVVGASVNTNDAGLAVTGGTETGIADVEGSGGAVVGSPVAGNS